MKFSMNQPNLIIPFAAAYFIITIILFFALSKKFKHIRKKIIAVWSLFCVLAAIIMFAAGSFGRFINVKTINTKKYTKYELTQDLNQLKKCIMNENPLYFADKDKLKNNFKTAYGEIKDGMTELEFYRLINPIVVSVGCGHTNLSISQALEINRKNTAKFFPIKVTFADNRLYFLENDTEHGIAAGDEIKTINGKSSSEIINILLNNISGDSTNKSKPSYILSRHFNNKFYDFVDTSDKFNVIFVNKDGITKTADLQAKYRDEFNTSAWELHMAQYKDGNYYESKIYNDYAVLSVHVFMQEKENKFNPFLDNFFLKLKNQHINKLIIDLRGNFGGDPNMAQTLLSHIITQKTDYFKCNLPVIYNLMGYQKPVSPSKNNFNGSIVVLTNGACFSTSGHLCSLIKYHKLGTIVGTETGGTYVCTDSSKDTVLNNTRIRLHYSTLTYKAAVKDLSKDNGIEPDIYISPSIEDILKNNDVQLECGIKELQAK